MKKIVLLTCLFNFCFLFYSQDARGLQNLVNKLDNNISIGEQYVLLIAINKYQQWSPLSNPVRDAKKIKQVLEKRYYIDKFIELYDENATKGNIIKTFKDLQESIKVNDSLLIFYAGHGHYDEEITKNAYWIPVDGGNDTILQENWLPNSIIKGMISGIKSKHILLVSDSCFSGDLLVAHRGIMPSITNEYLKNAFQKRSRQVITSGSSEVVPDESSFTRQFLLALEENDKQFVDSLALFEQIRLGVKGTTPMFGSLSGTDHQEGASFLFFLKDGKSNDGNIVNDKTINIEETYLNELVKINPKNMELKELEKSFFITKEIIEKSQARNLKTIFDTANKKLNDIKLNMFQIINKDMEENYNNAKKNNLFDPAINQLAKYPEYEKNYGIDNLTFLINRKIEEINSIKNIFEEKNINELSVIFKKNYASIKDIDENRSIITKIEDNMQRSQSKLNNLEQNIVKTKEYLTLKENIFNIRNKKEKFKKEKIGYIISGSVVMGLSFCAISTGITSLGLNYYYGGEVNKFYNTYKNSTVQSEIDYSYSKVVEYSSYSNGFLISGITTTIIGGVILIPAIILLGNLSRETIYNNELNDINKKIERLNIGLFYGNDKLNFSVSIKF
ncbi:MAG: hypothetical protein A2086_12500 [Spirochaetes bacterium GWD1_27_9]|nr:MAG: hypothetical protein A2Y34_07240 [Spirochaetes bacterium GWC1_27_15]OHD44280.1 MAG: hypothetical protein A2086_12500 [Spirochaetes bacterium GWD1_27_9]